MMLSNYSQITLKLGNVNITVKMPYHVRSWSRARSIKDILETSCQKLVRGAHGLQLLVSLHWSQVANMDSGLTSISSHCSSKYPTQYLVVILNVLLF